MFNFTKSQKLKKNLINTIKYLKMIAHADDDILQEPDKQVLQNFIKEGQNIDIKDANSAISYIEKVNTKMPSVANKKRYKFVYEWLDVLAVALSVAFGARSLFAQPFAIPTSSMQPTLFGIHYIEDTKVAGKQTLPHLPAPLHWLLYSTQAADLTVQESGVLTPINNKSGIKAFYSTRSEYFIFDKTKFKINNNYYEMPGKFEKIAKYCNLSERSSEFQQGEILAKGWLSSGDHLFVDRLSHHFTGLKRGDITIFTTANIGILGASGFYYIKRLIGMPGDTLKIINNMIYVKEKNAKEFKPITDFGIEAINRIYSGKGGYHGHTQGGSPQYLLIQGKEYIVPEKHFFMMGDNSANSYDGRCWGSVPRENIIGRPMFIFWPFSRRWGRIDNKPPLEIKTGHINKLPAMNLQ